MQTMSTAARQYATRPKDERFASVADLVYQAEHDQRLSLERAYNLKDLKIVPTESTLTLRSPKGQEAAFTHWSFGQLCRTLGAPASYLRELPPAIAADALNFGLQDSPAGTTANILLRAPNGNPLPIVRACTSDSYARVWDAALYSSIEKQIMQQQGRDGAWTLPPTWTGESAGAYRGDRDSFLITVNGGSIVTDPSLTNGRGSLGRNVDGRENLYRGILVRNSEVGAASIVIERILFEYVCGNHMLWGAVIDKTYRRRHVGAAALRDTMREIADLAWKWTNRTASSDEAIIDGLISSEIAHTKDAVIDELKKIGATKEQAENAVATCEVHFGASPRSYWGVAQGLTKQSQESGYQDERYQLDKLAAAVLSRGRKLVAA